MQTPDNTKTPSPVEHVPAAGGWLLYLGILGIVLGILSGVFAQNILVIAAAIAVGSLLVGLGSAINYLCTIAWHLDKLRDDLQKK